MVANVGELPCWLLRWAVDEHERNINVQNTIRTLSQTNYGSFTMSHRRIYLEYSKLSEMDSTSTEYQALSLSSARSDTQVGWVFGKQWLSSWSGFKPFFFSNWLHGINYRDINLIRWERSFERMFCRFRLWPFSSFYNQHVYEIMNTYVRFTWWVVSHAHASMLARQV
jgi:hypothetical protein